MLGPRRSRAGLLFVGAAALSVVFALGAAGCRHELAGAPDARADARTDGGGGADAKGGADAGADAASDARRDSVVDAGPDADLDGAATGPVDSTIDACDQGLPYQFETEVGATTKCQTGVVVGFSLTCGPGIIASLPDTDPANWKVSCGGAPTYTGVRCLVGGGKRVLESTPLPVASASGFAKCPPGTFAIAGGCECSAGVIASHPDPLHKDRWHCTCTTISSGHRAHAVCLAGLPACVVVEAAPKANNGTCSNGTAPLGGGCRGAAQLTSNRLKYNDPMTWWCSNLTANKPTVYTICAR